MSNEIIIVSRHAATVGWLSDHGVTGAVVQHVTAPDQVAGKIVVGNIPLYLAACAAEVWTVEIPGLPPEKRGAELTRADLDLYGAKVRRYRVTSID